MASTVKASQHWVHWFFSAIMFFTLALFLIYRYADININEYVTFKEPWIGTFDTRLMLIAIATALVMTVISLNYALPLDVMNENTRLRKQNRGFRRILRTYRDNPGGAQQANLAARALNKTGDVVIPFPDRERKDA